MCPEDLCYLFGLKEGGTYDFLPAYRQRKAGIIKFEALGNRSLLRKKIAAEASLNA